MLKSAWQAIKGIGYTVGAKVVETNDLARRTVSSPVSPIRSLALRHPQQLHPPTAVAALHRRLAAGRRSIRWLAAGGLAAILLSGGCNRSTPPVVTPEEVTVAMPGESPNTPVDTPLAPPSIDLPPSQIVDAGNPAASPRVDAAAPTDAAALADAAISIDAIEPIATADERTAAGQTAAEDSNAVTAATGAAQRPLPAAERALQAVQGAFLDSGDAPEDYHDWPQPAVALVLTGNQHGYIEPCGCTGLENQKGGLARRMTFMKQLADRDWELVPLDAGNQVRRFGRQAEIKFQVSAGGLEQLGYRAVGFGPDDLRLGVGELIAAVAATDDPEQGLFVSSNVILIDPSLTSQFRVIAAGGRTIGVTTALDSTALKFEPSGEIEINDVVDSVAAAMTSLQQADTDFRVLMFYGSEEAAAETVRRVAGFDLVVVAGGIGEPLYRPQSIEDSETLMIVTGNKGMFAGLVGLYDDGPHRYARVPLTHEFEDAAEMRQLMADYQNQLQAIGLAGLGLRPIEHPSGDRFVGSQVCGECHTIAYDIWEGSSHAHATQSIVEPWERGDIARHYDPECLSCHVTGWNPQNYFPYESGYLSLQQSAHLTGNGCENCHGPGEKHVIAERNLAELDERTRLREAMRLTLDQAKDTCLQCHDLDNSPDFHKEGAFDDYWAEIAHEGMD